MKQTLRRALCLLVALLAICALFACTRKESTTTTEPGAVTTAPAIWQSATYKENAEVGEGSITFTLAIEAKGKTVTLTVHTNESNLGQALFALNLVNDASFFDVANGMKADWNADSAYWAFYKGTEYMMVGIDAVTLAGGEQIRFVYTTM